MKKINVGVIGVGYLGQFHAEKYAHIPNAELIGIVDEDQDRATQIAKKLDTEALPDISRLIGRVDAVSIVVPTIYHYRIAKQCLEQGIHVLIEKPITESLDQADELIALASEKGLVLQVGHIERFNPAVRAVKARLTAPRYLSAERAAPFTMRCTDVNVVLDLMIHDLDIVMDLVGADPLEVSAAGASVITKQIDAAQPGLFSRTGAWLTSPPAGFPMKRNVFCAYLTEIICIRPTTSCRRPRMQRAGTAPRAPLFRAIFLSRSAIP